MVGTEEPSKSETGIAVPRAITASHHPRSPWRAYLSVVFCASLFAVSLAYSLKTCNRMIEMRAPLMGAAMELGIEAALAHLWFEEFLSGDRSEDIAEVWARLDQSASYARAMLDGGRVPSGLIVPLEDPQLRREIQEVLSKLSDFRAIAEERFAAKEGAAAGAELDRRFDAVFEDLLAQSDRVGADLRRLTASDLRRFHIVQGVLIGACALMAVALVFGLGRYDRARTRTLLALAQSEENLRITLESIGDAVIATDTQGRVTRMNPVAEAMTGWTSAEAEGRPLPEVFQIINVQTRMEVQNPVEKVYRDGLVVGLANHTLLIARDGTERQIADSGAPIRNQQGAIIGVVLVFRDVTEAYAKDLELREAHVLLNATGRMAKVGGWELDAITNEVTWSEETARIHELPLGYKPTRDQLIDFFHPDERQAIADAVQRAIDHGEAYDLETRFITAKGKHLWTRMICEPILENGKTVKLRGTFLDITDRKLATLEATRFGRVLESALNEIYIFDAQTLRFMQVNRGARENLGYSIEELYDLTPIDLKPELTTESFAELVAPLRAGDREKVEFVTVHRRKDGSLYPVEVHLQLAGEGEPMFVALILDITERVLAEEATKDKQDQLDDLLSNMGVIVLEGNPFDFNYVGGQVERMLGYPKQAWFDDPQGPVGFWAKHLHPVDRGVADVCKAAIEKGQDHSFEYRMIAADGNVVWFHDAVTVETENGKPIKTRSVMVDITQQKRAAEELASAHRLLEAVIEQAPIPMVIAAPGGELTLFNAAVIQQLGLDDSSPLQRGMNLLELERTWIDYYANGDRVPIDQLPLTLALEGKTTKNLEIRVVRADGTEGWEVVNAAPIYDDGDQLIAALVAFPDITDRKKAEEALRRSEERLDLAVRGTSDGMWDGEIATGKEYWSPRYVELLGYGPDEVEASYDQFLAFLHPEDRDDVHEAGRLHLEENLPYDREFRLRTKSGEYRWFQSRGEASRDESGRAYRFAGSIRDITERKQSDAIRVGQRRILEQIAKSNTSLIEVLETIIHVTENLFTNIRATILLAKGNKLFSGSAPSMPTAYNDAINGMEIGPNAGSCGTAASRGERVIVSDVSSDPLWADFCHLGLEYGFRACWSEPVFDANKRVVATFALYRDKCGFPTASEIQLIEGMANLVSIALERQQTSEERNRLATAIEQAGESIAITDVLGMIQYINPAFERTTGFAATEVIGRSHNIVKSGSHDVAFYKDMWGKLASGQTWRSRFINKRKDGSLFLEDTVISPVRDTDGKIINFVAVNRDVTKEVALEDQLRQAQKMEAIGQLAGGVAHDFNNLLTAILGNSEMLLSAVAREAEKLSEEMLRSGLEQIQSAGKQAASLTRQLLAFGRREIIRAEVLDPKTVIGDIEDLLRGLIGEHVQLDLTLGAGTYFIHADPGQVEQVVMNLVVNAADAMPEGGRIEVRIEEAELDEASVAGHPDMKPGRYVKLCVIDSGAGMTPNTLERMYEPFFTTKPEGTGTGLGLALVYGTVKKLGGHISVDSRLSEGSTFTVYVPVADKQQAEGKLDGEADPVSMGETILVCEDQDAVRDIICQTLAVAGFEAIEVEGGEQALEAMATHGDKIDLLISDIVMPGMSGRELADNLRQEHPDLRVLFVSGHSSKHLDASMVRGRGTEFLQKPFGPTALLERVRELLEVKRTTG